MHGKVTQKFSTIIFVALCGVLSNCLNYSDIEDYCVVKQDWLIKYVGLRNVIPSEWILRKVFTLLDPDYLELLQTIVN